MRRGTFVFHFAPSVSWYCLLAHCVYTPSTLLGSAMVAFFIWKEKSSAKKSKSLNLGFSFKFVVRTVDKCDLYWIFFLNVMNPIFSNQTQAFSVCQFIKATSV